MRTNSSASLAGAFSLAFLMCLPLLGACGDAEPAGPSDSGALPSDVSPNSDTNAGWDADSSDTIDAGEDANADTSEDASTDDVEGDADEGEVAPPITGSRQVGMVGSCIERPNQPFLLRFDLSRLGFHPCALRCEGANSPACLQQCFVDEERITAACSDCLGSLGVCTQNLCDSACPGEWTSNDASCSECRAEQCGVEFRVCAGTLVELPDSANPPLPALNCAESGGTGDLSEVIEDIDERCWEDCRWLPRAGECVALCVGDQLSPTCATCIETYIECSRDCGWACLDDPFHPTCYDCKPHCVNSLEACTLSSVRSLSPPSAYGGVRLINLAPTHPYAALVLVGDGSPIARAIPFPGGSAFTNVAAGEVEVGLTTGQVGSAAVPTTTTLLQLPAYTQGSVIAVDAPDGPKLHTQSAPTHVSRPRSARVVNAYPDNNPITVSVNSQVLPALEFGEVSLEFEPERTVDLRIELADSSARQLRGIEIGSGAEVTFVIFPTASASGVSVAIVQSPGPALITPTSNAESP